MILFMHACRVKQLATLSALALLAACSTTTLESNKEDITSAPEAPITSPVAAEPIPKEQLLNLLTAELASQYGDDTTALQSYRREGAALNDPNLLLAAQLAAERNRDFVAMEQNLQRWLALFPEDLNAHRASLRSAAAQGDGERLFNEAAQLFTATDSVELLFSAASYLKDSAELNRSFIASVNRDRDSANSRSPAQRLAFQLLDCQLQARTASTVKARQALIQCSLHISQSSQQRSGATLEILWRKSIQLTVQLLTQSRRHFEAIALLKQTTREHPDAALKFDLARLLLNLDRPTARTTLAEVVKLDPTHHQARLLQAVLHIDNRDIPSAEPLLKAIPEQSRWFSDAQYQLGRIADFYGQPKRALMHFRRVQPGIHFDRAMQRTAELLLQLNGLPQFDRWVRLQHRQYPEYSEQFYLLDIELTSAQRSADAQLQLLEAATANLPNSLELQTLLAQQLEKNRDFARAAAQWQRILNTYPNQALALSSLGNIKVSHLAQLDEGQKLLYRASQLAPENPVVLNHLGWALYQLGDIEGALEQLLRARALDDNAMVASHLGEVYWQLEKPEKAINLWREALRSFPDAHYVRDTIDRLDIDLNGVYE